MKRKLSLISAILAFAVLIVSSGAAAEACRRGISVCLELIIPSLFPFFVLSLMLNRLGLPSALGHVLTPLAARIYGVSGAGASALIIGLLGGYPLGAAYIADMRRSGAVSVGECERLLAFCNNSGPAFLIGAIGGGVFGSARVGVLLYLVHVLSALLTGLFFRGKNACTESQPILLDSEDIAASLPECVKQAAVSLVNVCAFVVFFTVLAGVLDSGGAVSLLCGSISAHFGWELHFTRALLMGILELGSAAGAMQGLAVTPHNLALAACLVGWGGVSVHMQTAAVLNGTNIKGALHFAGRLISAAAAAVLAYALGILFIS